MDTMTGGRKTRDQFIVRGLEREESPLRLQLSMRFRRLAKHPHQRHCHASVQSFQKKITETEWTDCHLQLNRGGKSPFCS